MDETQRRNMVMYHEGQLLHYAGSNGEGSAAEVARCMIDAAVNVLYRVEEPEDTAKFAFALSDRMVGRVKGATMWPPAMRVEVVAPVPAAAEKASSARFWSIYGFGWFVGFAMGACVGRATR